MTYIAFDHVPPKYGGKVHQYCIYVQAGILNTRARIKDVTVFIGIAFLSVAFNHLTHFKNHHPPPMNAYQYMASRQIVFLIKI